MVTLFDEQQPDAAMVRELLTICAEVDMTCFDGRHGQAAEDPAAMAVGVVSECQRRLAVVLRIADAVGVGKETGSNTTATALRRLVAYIRTTQEQRRALAMAAAEHNRMQADLGRLEDAYASSQAQLSELTDQLEHIAEEDGSVAELELARLRITELEEQLAQTTSFHRKPVENVPVARPVTSSRRMAITATRRRSS